MPFSFKPDVTTEPPQGEQPAPPQASFGHSAVVPSAAVTPVERLQKEGKSVIQILLFAVSGFAVLVTIALLGYKYYLSSQVEAKKATLAGYEAQLAGLPLEDMRKLSNRLKVIDQLIKEHPSVNVAFLIVEASVENMVTFTKFDLHYSENIKSYQLTLAGLAPDYKSVAQQMDTYKRKPYSTYVSKVVVDGLFPDTTGQIGFTLSMPISIKGLIPETFSIMDGTSTGTTSVPLNVPITISTTTSPVLGTTTPANGAKNATASTTAQARKP